MSRQHEIPTTNLAKLVAANYLAVGQILHFHLNGERLHGLEYTAIVTAGKNLLWRDVDGRMRLCAMSAIARELLPRHGRKPTKERGPLFWYTDDGKSVNKIWLAYCDLVQLSNGTYLTTQQLEEIASI